MRKTIIFYCPHIEGHKLEYIHHLFEGASHFDNADFVIVVPEKFKSLSQLLEWRGGTNITFEYLNLDERLFHFKGILKSWHLNNSLRSYVAQYKACHVFLIDIIPYLPFLVFQKTKVSGIIYRIYPYGRKTEKRSKMVVDYLRQLMLVKTHCVENIMVLNDESGAFILNKRFRTNKYSYIADPIPNNGEREEGYCIRDVYGIGNDKIVLLHAGGMLRYKGTLNILESILLLSQKERERFCFVFAGRVTDEIKDEFFDLYNKANDVSSIVLIEGYLSFERINSLFYQSDYILIPYYPRLQSSGIIGIAALFNKPVITTKQGVVGRLVQHYQLGLLIDNNEPEAINSCLTKLNKTEIVNGYNYVRTHRVEDFTVAVFSLFR